VRQWTFQVLENPSLYPPTMKHLFAFLLILIASIGMAGAQPLAPGKGPHLPMAEAAARAQVITDLLRNHRFVQTAQQFDSLLKTQLSAKQIETIWNRLENQMGKFQGMETPGIDTTKPGYTIAVQPVMFGSEMINMRLAFNSKGELSGLFFTPYTALDGWVPPTYGPIGRIDERKVGIASGRFVLPATFSLPRTPATGKPPVVLLVHGSGPNDRDETVGGTKVFKDLAYGLSAQGIATLRYDKRTLVFANMLPPDSLSVEVETIDDAVAALNKLRHDPAIDTNRIWVLGHSMGGNLAPAIALRAPFVQGIIIMAGNTIDMPTLYRNQIAYIGGLQVDTIKNGKKRLKARLKEIDGQNRNYARLLKAKPLPAAYKPGTTLPEYAPDLKTEASAHPKNGLPLNLPAEYWLSMRRNAPQIAVPFLPKKLPVLVLQGERDYQITEKDFAEWKSLFGGNPDATFSMFGNLNHAFVSGSGKATPKEYEKTDHVSQDAVQTIAAKVLSFK